MTSFLTGAAVTPLILALVPCLFAGMKSHATGVSAFLDDQAPPALREAAAPEIAERAPWWKPAALGIDNYS